MLASIAILTLFGIFLLILETFLPGWVAGILGTLSILAAVWLTMASEELAGWSSGARLALALAIVVGSGAIMLAWLRWFAVKFFQRTFTLSAAVGSTVGGSNAAVIGQQGVAISELRPLGRAEIGGRRYEVRCQSGIAAAGTRVEVIASEPGNLLVRTV
ncbi:MAG: NfeD family protein [Prosthecobacter sp.]|jgi:membrane-bound serine protease (ClpP class)|uniref:NfeD family protein n=1 Tax=Prosthecobacter sp. TaxID=1965333 RepID=UPI001A0A7361|nr:NfeD family protein [Prosthecobacter sp.]MBE2283050.1 NfeD family protein [Prosthecobacter sp.]